MSVTFYATDSEGRPVGGLDVELSGCLCAQDAPSWAYPLPELTPELKAELRSHADPYCLRCAGTGLKRDEIPALELNLCNANARALLELLGGLGGSELGGTCPVPEARRAVMGARARFDRLAPELTREPEVLRSKRAVVEGDDGVARFVGGTERGVVGGLDEEGLRDRLERFARFVEQASDAGARSILWG